MKLTLKNLVVIGLAAFILIAILFMPFMTVSSPLEGESESASFMDILDTEGDTGVIVTFTIFSIICTIGMAVTSVMGRDKKIVLAAAVAGLVCLFIATLDFPDDVEIAGKTVLEVGAGVGIWLSWICYIAAGAISYLEIPALDKSLN